MKSSHPVTRSLIGCLLLFSTSTVHAQDWPQWRGTNRDGKATGFTAPKAWPKELTKKWNISVGNGVASPALVGDKLYVFSYQKGSEILRCLDAATGKELWQDSYESQNISGIAAGRGGEYAGPRSSPTVADGKVVTLGCRGTLSCYDAATGKKLWRKDDFRGAVPRFYTSSSPIVVNGSCIAQLGGDRDGGIAAYDLTTGESTWKWTGDGPAYASPVLLIVGGTNAIVAETSGNIVGINAKDGKLLWKGPYPSRPMDYNAATPLIDSQTVIFSAAGRGTKAVKVEKKGDEFSEKELWVNKQTVVQFSSPVVRDGFIFGLSNRDALFCINIKDGKTAWTSPIPGKRGYGTIVDAGSVLMAMTPNSELVVYEPSDKEFKQLAKYKVSSKDTYAYPIVAGNRIFVKDHDSLTLFMIE